MFQEERPDHFDEVKGRVEENDYYIMIMKEPDYMIFFISTYGNTERRDKEETNCFAIQPV